MLSVQFLRRERRGGHRFVTAALATCAFAVGCRHGSPVATAALGQKQNEARVLSLPEALAMGSSYPALTALVPGIGPLETDAGDNCTQAKATVTLFGCPMQWEFNYHQGRLVNYGLHSESLPHEAAMKTYRAMRRFLCRRYGDPAVYKGPIYDSPPSFVWQSTWQTPKVNISLCCQRMFGEHRVGWGVAPRLPEAPTVAKKERIHGSRTIWYEGGQLLAEMGFSMPASEGPYLIRYPSRHVRERADWKDFSKKHGEHSFWHRNGQKCREEFYANGLRCGTWTEWDRSGRVVVRGTYRDGEPWEGTFNFLNEHATYLDGSEVDRVCDEGTNALWRERVDHFTDSPHLAR